MNFMSFISFIIKFIKFKPTIKFKKFERHNCGIKEGLFSVNPYVCWSLSLDL